MSSKDRKQNILSTRIIIKVIHEETEKDIWTKTKKLGLALGEEEKIVALHNVECLPIEKMPKLTQLIFSGSKAKITIYTPQNNKTEEGKGERQRNTYALMVRCPGGNYRETLKNVRTGLREIPAANAIQRVRSTRDGKMLITVEKDEGKCEQLTERR